MTRKTDREVAAAALLALNSYAAVYDAPRRALGGISPVALIQSSGMTTGAATRGAAASLLDNLLTVTIYVRADIGDEAAAEDTLDTLARASVLALLASGFTIDRTDAAPDGAPLRNSDGVFYRVERLFLSREEST